MYGIFFRGVWVPYPHCGHISDTSPLTAARNGANCSACHSHSDVIIVNSASVTLSAFLVAAASHSCCCCRILYISVASLTFYGLSLLLSRLTSISDTAAATADVITVTADASVTAYVIIRQRCCHGIPPRRQNCRRFVRSCFFRTLRSSLMSLLTSSLSPLLPLLTSSLLLLLLLPLLT